MPKNLNSRKNLEDFARTYFLTHHEIDNRKTAGSCLHDEKIVIERIESKTLPLSFVEEPLQNVSSSLQSYVMIIKKVLSIPVG